MRESRNAIVLDAPAPPDGKGVGETRSLRFTAFQSQGQGPLSRGADHIRPHRDRDLFLAGSSSRYLADALAF